MKKASLLLIIFTIIITLSGCKSEPFTAPFGTEFVESNSIEYYYFNGETSVLMFEYIFSEDIYYFKSPISGSYDFKTINNYQMISDEFKMFLASYDDYIIEDRYIFTDHDGSLALSLGATETDYNTIDVIVDDDVYDVDAYISIENGLRAIFSYTEFYSDGELIIIPFHLSIISVDMHEAYLKEYLPENNDYVSEKAILTKYITTVIPVPPKTIINNVGIYNETTDLADLGYYLTIVKDNSTLEPHTEIACDEDVFDNCFSIEFTTITGTIYDLDLIEVFAFYQSNYNGSVIDDYLLFENSGNVYKIVLSNSIVNIDPLNTDSELITVVTFEISIYQN